MGGVAVLITAFFLAFNVNQIVRRGNIGFALGISAYRAFFMFGITVLFASVSLCFNIYQIVVLLSDYGLTFGISANGAKLVIGISFLGAGGILFLNVAERMLTRSIDSAVAFLVSAA